MPSNLPEIKIRLTPEEKALVEAAAFEAGMSASAFALQCCLHKRARMTERNDLLILNLVERAVVAIEEIAVKEDGNTSPAVVASNLARADRLIVEVGKLRSMLGGTGR